MEKDIDHEKFFDKQKYLENIIPLLQHYLTINDYKNAYLLLVNMIPKISPISKTFIENLKYKRDDSSS